MYLRKIISLLLFIVCSQTAFAEISLPAIFSDNMVLQQRSMASLWGKASADHKVTVTTSWDNKQYVTRSDKAGKWKVEVRTPVAGGPYRIIFDDGSKFKLKNVLIGEVWVCSGQSNMEISMKGYSNQPILNSNKILMHAHDSLLRLFHVQRKVSNRPMEDCEGAWKISSPQNAATFSAVGFQFARMLRKTLKVPVGIIEAAWGGTPIKAWMDEKSLQHFPELKILSNEKPGSQHPACLFNGMISPIAGYGIKGFIWYQGEWDRRKPSMYKALMMHMVKGWRTLWKRDDLPFYYVQIAPYGYKGKFKDSVPYVREAQAQAMETIPHAGMVVSMDVGSKYTIHPPDKTTIARRLQYWALGDAYHWEGISYRSPTFKSMQVKDHSVTVTFTQTPLGLTSYDQKIKGFEVAGKDKEFYPAEAEIKGKGKVLIKCDEVTHPVAVRYLFKAFAVGNLYNTAGLPLAPFRTDSW